MSSEAVRNAMNAAFQKLSGLDQTDFQYLIHKHEDGPIARALLESGMFEGRVAEARARERLFNGSLESNVVIVNQTEKMQAKSCLTPFRYSGTVTIASKRSLSRKSGWNNYVIAKRGQKTKQLAWAA